jgi:succinate dehydrogenase/fumarate reductase flavoprotein subunit
MDPRKTPKTMKSDTNSIPMSLDLMVVGGGLAGCAMVWQAIRRGLSVALVDQLSPESSSRVAAGLVFIAMFRAINQPHFGRSNLP